MARRTNRINRDWETPEDYRWEHVAIEVLQDIRNELQAINRRLSCFRIPRALDAVQRIDKRLSETRKLKGGRNAKA